jgi:predicted ATPase
MEALFVPGLTQLYRGEFEASRRHCEQGLALYDPERNRLHARSTGQNSGVTMRCYLALALWHLGYPDQARAHCEEFLALARTLNHPFTLAYALHHAAWLHQHCRLGPEAQAFGQEMVALATEQGFAFWKASGMLYRGAGLLLQKETGRGLADVREGLAAYRATGAELALPYYLSFLAEAQAQSGRIGEALGLLDEALAAAERCHDRFHEAEIWRCRGELLLVRAPAEVSAAEASFIRALETARAQAARSWELRAALSLSRLWRRQGKPDEAGRLLAEAYGRFTEGLNTPDLADARALLAEWGLANV